MKSKTILIIVISLIVGGWAGIALYRFMLPETGSMVTASGSQPSAMVPKTQGTASFKKIAEWYEAVGTIRPRTESRISAQVTAQIVDVRVRPGDRVKKEQVMVILDNRQLSSRLDQAKQGLKAAEAGENQARQAVFAAEAGYRQSKAEYERIQKVYRSQAATKQALDKAESIYQKAKAGLEQAREALSGAKAGIRKAEEIIKEAQIALGYTKIKAPEEGEVLERLAEPGDMALPGKPLVTLRTAGSLRIEAFVREGLIKNVSPGETLKVTIDTLQTTVDVRVEEVVPYADPKTRTFLVKSSLPEISGLFPGMFGKLLIPVREHEVVVIPAQAYRRVGQLEVVTVKDGGQWKTVYVKLGRQLDGEIEVLSGLSGGETIGWGK